MAYIIGDDFEDKFIGTELEFTDGDQALKDFFAKTPRAPGSILDATWFTGTSISPEVVPTRARIIEGNALYDGAQCMAAQPLSARASRTASKSWIPVGMASFR